MVGIIQEFKQKIGQEAERIIATGLNLEQRGKKYRCLNPYAHRNGDNTPSMSWDPNRLQFYCFGCGLKIDIYSYYKDHPNYTHKEIMRNSAWQATSKLLSYRRTVKPSCSKSNSCNQLPGMYRLYSAGITKETIDAFELQSYKGRIAFPLLQIRKP